MLKAIRDFNRKSLAKISVRKDRNVLEMVPFLLHPAFLLKTLKKMFTERLKPSERGVIVCIDSKGVELLEH
jgi:hypothetical protein